MTAAAYGRPCENEEFRDANLSLSGIGLTVINVPGHFSPVATSNQNVDGSCPELWTPRLAISQFRTECQAPELVGPGAHNLDQVLKVTLLFPFFMERDTFERMGPDPAFASGTRPFSKGAYSSSFPMVCSCSVETVDRVQS